MRANVGTDEEWSSAAPNLDRFVACASSLFDSFSSTGKMPDHPLLSSNTNNDGLLSASSPSPTRRGIGDVAGGEGRSDPRESPGARSPGVRSPGFPPYWLGPGSGEGRRGGGRGGGGGRRRMSTPVGQGTGRGNRSNAHRRECDGGGGSTTLIASPPRARSRSTVAGGVHAAGGALERKPRRRMSTGKEVVGDGDPPGAPTPPTHASPPRDAMHSKDAAATTVSAASGAEANSTNLKLSTPKRLPV